MIAMDKVLKGKVILDLTSMWAGPFATLLLAGLGAKVIKIESQRRPDGTRSATRPGMKSPVFEVLNHDKQGYFLELDRTEDYRIFMKLVKEADMVIENYSPRVKQNLRIDFAHLYKVNPQILLISMPAIGGEGTDKDYIAYGAGIEAASGVAWLTGYQDHFPVGSGVPFSDPLCGMYGAMLAIAALMQKEHDQGARHIELSQVEVVRDVIQDMFVNGIISPSFSVSEKDIVDIPDVYDVWSDLRNSWRFLDRVIPYLTFPWHSIDTSWGVLTKAPEI